MSTQINAALLNGHQCSPFSGQINDFRQRKSEKETSVNLSDSLRNHQAEMDKLVSELGSKLPCLSDSLIGRVERHTVHSENANVKKNRVLQTLKGLREVLKGNKNYEEDLSLLELKEVINFLPDSLCNEIQVVHAEIKEIDAQLIYYDVLKNQTAIERKKLDSLKPEKSENAESSIRQRPCAAEIAKKRKMPLATPRANILLGNIFSMLWTGFIYLFLQIGRGIAYCWNTLWY